MDMRARPDAGRAAKHAAGLDRGVGADLDVGVDPGRGGVDDRDAGEHVAVGDAAARLGGRERQVGAVVDAEVRRRIGGRRRRSAERPSSRSSGSTSPR